MINLKCVFGHAWSAWQHDNAYIQSANAQVRFCDNKDCHKWQRKYNGKLQ